MAFVEYIRHAALLRTVGITLGVTALCVYLLKKLRQLIIRHGRTIINGVFWILERVLTRSISAKLSMRRYCSLQLANESGRYLQVPGSRSTALDVDEVFVPLTLELGGRNKTYTNTNLLGAGSRLIVVGDPGCGKSTLVKRIFRDTCWDTYDRPSRGKLPIRLELKNLTPPSDAPSESEIVSWLMTVLENSVSQVEGFEMYQLFDSWSTDAGLLVLLDGLDEVASEKYGVISAGIRTLSRRLAELSSNNTVVLTMRIQFHQQVRQEFEEDYPQVLYVRPFLPSEIFTFLNRWPFGNNKRRTVNRIYGELTDRPTLREMCSNPLVLAMYVENDYESGGADAPDTRTQFYEKVVTELLIKRRRRQDIATGRSVSLREQREQILGDLALQNLTDRNQDANSLSWKQAISITREVYNCDSTEAEFRLRELASETGLISEERTGESLRFIHLTFCEFLAANQCAKGLTDGWQLVIDRHRDFVKSGEPQLQTRLIEVLPFAQALLPRVDRSKALADVADLNDRLVLGRCFLETQLYGQPEWRRYLRDERDYLANVSEEEWDEEKIRRLHLFSVVVRDARDWYSAIARVSVEPELRDAFANIVGGDPRIVAKVFTTYASQDASAALRLAEEVGVDMLTEYPNVVVESCQEEPFLALALDSVRSSRSNSWAAILVESALTYSNVAYRLDSTPCVGDINFHPSANYEDLLRMGWVEKGSYYELLLSKVLDDDDFDPRLSNISDMQKFIGPAKYFAPLYHLRFLLPILIVMAGIGLTATAKHLPDTAQYLIVIPVTFLSLFVALVIYALIDSMRAMYLAFFNFVAVLDHSPGISYAIMANLLRIDIVRRMLFPTLGDTLAKLTDRRQDEPYKILLPWYPVQSGHVRRPD